jgi:outer membrane protein OmpA-like peptidoglycan-associated protein
MAVISRIALLAGLTMFTAVEAEAQVAVTGGQAGVDELAERLMPKIAPPVPTTRSFKPASGDPATRGISTITPAAQPSQVVALKVEFDSGSANLRPEGKATLDKLALGMNKVKKVVTRSLGDQQRLVLSMVGHTDHRGDDDYNNRLSEDRAKSAKRYLKEYWGYTDAEIETAWKGKSEPVDRRTPCDDACMQENRRVEVQTVVK